MFRIGDRVKCKTVPHKDNYQLKAGNNCVGKMYTIINIHPQGFLRFKNEDNGWFNPEFFILYKELLTEIDYLNAFQQNFKEGV